MKRQTPRQPHDFYETPPHYLEALYTVLLTKGRAPKMGVVYEPCVGGRAIADFIEQNFEYKNIYTNDLDKKRNADWHLDARSTRAWDMLKIDWTITNPPF